MGIFWHRVKLFLTCMIWNTLVSSSLLMESRFLRLIQAPLMLEPTRWCWGEDRLSTVAPLHLDLQRHVRIVAEDCFHVRAKHSRQLVEGVHLARVNDQVVPGKEFLEFLHRETYLRAILNASTGLPPITYGWIER